MKTFFAAALAAVSSARLLTQADYKFMEFIVKYGKSYSTTEEFESRRDNFVGFLETVDRINSDPKTKHTAGINPHAANSE